LERDLLINKVVLPVSPPHVEYRLTDKGHSIMPVLDAICEWGLAHTPEDQLERFGHQSIFKCPNPL